MILHHQELSQISLQFNQKLKYSDNCDFIPIKIKDYAVIQTPLMFIPYGIFTIPRRCVGVSIKKFTVR